MSSLLDRSIHIVREAVNYASIAEYKALFNQGRAKCERLTTTDFLVLAPANDPFYVGATSPQKWGTWFAENWQRFKGNEPSIHVRALHYTLSGKSDTSECILMPNGKVYENTVKCWKTLEKAGKYARYLSLLDPARFSDRRAQTFIERIYDEPHNYLWVSDPSYNFTLDFPDFPDLPFYYVSCQNRQRYRIEVWFEKSTQEEKLVPIMDKYRVTMLSAQGELSISAMLKAIHRANNSVLPTRILYISDFDPAGRSMPVAASRKLEFLQSLTRSHADMQLYPIALTHDQCVTYQLPRMPIKESERRKTKFEDRYGNGATELDALEDRYPGELVRLVEREILHFLDSSLERRTREQAEKLRQECKRIQADTHGAYNGEALEADYTLLKSEFEEWYERRFLPFKSQLESAYQGIQEELEEHMPDIDEYPLPEAKEVQAGEHCLYDSTRDYVEQLTAYSAFTGKFSHLIEDENEDEEQE